MAEADELDQPGSLAPMGAQPPLGPTGVVSSSAGQRLSQQLTVELLEDDWEIDFADIKLGGRIGIGSYGEVYKGVWRHAEVAVKKLLEQEVGEQMMKEFRRVRGVESSDDARAHAAPTGGCHHEAHAASQHHHVPWRGHQTTQHGHRHAVCCTWEPVSHAAPVPGTRLSAALCGVPQRLPQNAEPLDERRRLRMARDIASGMNYLASCKPPIVHRCVACRCNVYLDLSSSMTETSSRPTS